MSIHIATMGLLLPSPSTPPTNILQPGATLTGPVQVMSRCAALAPALGVHRTPAVPKLMDPPTRRYVMSDCLGIGRAATISATQPRKGGTQPVMAVNLYDPCDDYDPCEAMSKTRPASAAHPADWPRPAKANSSPRHDLALTAAS